MRFGGILAAVAASAAAVAPVTPGTQAAAATSRATGQPVIAWSPCASPAGYRCGSVRVPVDYAHPGGASLSIAVIEKPASDPRGTPGVLLFNPGGPGESGVQILPVLAGLVPPAVSRQFDLVSFDERGTGASDRLACGPAPSAVAATPPVGTAAPVAFPLQHLPTDAAVFSALATSCLRRYPSLLAQINTTNAARDMDRIRQALGVARIDYWGLSYGTVLGSEYAHLFPHRVRAMILDGAVDATQSLTTQARGEAPAVIGSLRHFFTTCATSAQCLIGPDPSSYFERLAASLARQPLPAPGDGDGVPVTVGDLYTATLFYLSVPAYAGAFPTALLEAAQGSGAPLRALSLDFELDIDGTSLVGPQWAYACNDAAAHPGLAAASKLARTLARRYGPVGAYAVTYTLGGCVDWPRAADPVTDVRVAGGPPIVVIGNTGDPNTPHSAAVALAHALGTARLVTWRGWGHTWLLNGSSDPCMQRVVVGYLVGTRPPAAATTCA
jgi:pimeloyl-ACP methyl ester carboxylesterase